VLNKKLETPIKDLYWAYNTLPIPILHEFQILIFMHKCCYHRESISSVFHDYFVANCSIHSRDTRIKSNLHLSAAQTNAGLSCSSHCGSKMWNELPAH